MTRCNLLVPFVIAAGLCLAQQPGTPPPQAAPGGGAANAVTGCLSKGSSPGEYELTNEKGEKVKLISSEDLSKHVSHKVRVTGSAGKEQDKTVLRVEGVEHVADSCS